MKYSLLLSILVSSAGMCQQTDAPVSRKSNKITATFSDTAGLFSRVAIALVDAGYNIAAKDAETGLISAVHENPVRVDRLTVRVVIRPGTLQVTGTFEISNYRQPLTYAKGRDAYGVSWQQVHKVIEGMRPEKITYEQVK